MAILVRYIPVDEDDVFDILNVLDDRLKHANSAVVLAAAGEITTAQQSNIILLEYTDGLQWRDGAPHQCPLDVCTLASIHADVFATSPLITPRITYYCRPNCFCISQTAWKTKFWLTCMRG